MSLCPTLVPAGTRALGKVLFLDCQLERNVPEETPKACIPSLLPSLPHPLDTSIGGATLRKEAGGGNPTTRRHGAHGLFKALPAQRLHILWVQ